MNRFTNMLKPEAEVRLRTTIGAISGLAIERLTAMPVSPAVVNATTADKLEVVVKLSGWSPTLNLITMHWRCIVDDGADAARQGRQALRGMDAKLRLQRERLAEAMTLGRASPFGVADGADGHIEDTQVGHVLVDRVLAGMIGGHQTIVREVGNTMDDLHHDEPRDGLEIELVGEQTPEHGEDSPGMHAFRKRLFVFEMPLAGGATYDGERLTIPRRLPATVIAASIGRTLGEIADVPAPMSDRIVVKAEVRGKGVAFTVEPVTSTVDELIAEGFGP